MKKRKKLFRRGLTLALTLLLALGCLWPSLVTDAAEFSIDDSGFSNPKIDHQTLYIWRRGFPEATKPEDVGRKRDVLITWDGKYFLKWDQSFMIKVFSLFPMYKNGNATKLNIDHVPYPPAYNTFWGTYDWDYAWDITWRNGRYPYDKTNNWGNSYRDYPNGYPHGAYMYTVDYKTNAGMVSNLPFSFKALDESNVYGSLKPVTDVLPFAAYAGKNESDGTPEYGFGMHDTADPNNAGYWLASDHGLHTWNQDVTLGADIQHTYVRATLDYWRGGAGGIFTNNGKHSFADSTWLLYSKEGSKKVSIESNGLGYRHVSNKGYADNQDKRDLYHLSGSASVMLGYMALGHEGSVFRTVGNANQLKYTQDHRPGVKGGRSPYLQDGKDSFDVFWCEPVIMDYLQTSFTIQDGQVSNFDGPMAITAGTVITVKDGGTLTIDGWVANNGTIRVEKGGTLYIQDDACLNRINDGTHTGGGVICEGLIIVGSNAKLVGGGVDGIQLKGAAHVVNYGLLAGENFLVENSYAIENRMNGVVFSGAGYGVIGSGMGTWGNPVTAKGFMEKGKVEDVCYVNLAPNAIYNN